MHSHWDVNKLDEVTNEAHDSKANSDGFADLSEFCTDLNEPGQGSIESNLPFCEGLVQRTRN